MLIDEQFRKCAALLGVSVQQADGSMGGVAAGTAFFVSMPIDALRLVVYVVTAQHVVHGARPLGMFYVRVNVNQEAAPPGSPGFLDFPIAPDAWIDHPMTDVAVAPMPALNNLADWRHLPYEMIASDSYVREHGVGIGDEVFFTGLFSPLPGRERFLPIVRFGNLSMMPNEKVPIEIDRGTVTMVDAYLAEARSWGGHSGSPTFIYYPPDRNPGSLTVGGQAPSLLGLISAHFPIRRQRQYLRDSLDSTVEADNAGIAVVILAQAILEVLMGDELVAQREKITKEVESQPEAVTDTGLPEAPKAEEVFE